MDTTTSATLRRTAHLLEAEAQAVHRAVAGLPDLAGPQTWVGGAPRRLVHELEQAVHHATTAAEQLVADATTARRRAEELARREVLSSLPQP